jgi:large subunit ribosomal protein L24
MKVRIKKGDTVEVIAGNEKGKRGQVIKVVRAKEGKYRVVIQGLNIRKKHQKQAKTGGRQNLAPGIIQFEGSIDISNVMLVDPKSDEPTRIGLTRDGQTHKVVRVARKSGEAIDR